MGKKLSEYSKDEMVALLKSDVAKWKRLWSEKPDLLPELSGADLSDAKLEGAFLRSVYLTLAKLDRAILRDADLGYAFLAGANLVGADLVGAYLKGARLEWAILKDAKLAGANLRGANLEYADLTRANLGDVDLGDANLAFANLVGANLVSANLKSANLRDANLAFANLKNADLGNVDLQATNFANADLEGTKGPFTLDKETVEISGSLPKNFLIASGIPESLVGQLQDHGSTITITFTRKVWGQLLPIENALSLYLKDDYFIEKSSNRIVVKLASPELIQQTLQGVLPVLAGIEEEAPNEVAEVEISPEGGEVEKITAKEIVAAKELSLAEETLLELYKHPLNPLRFTHPYFRRFLENIPEEKTTFRAIYERFKVYGQAMVGIGKLERKERGELPPGEEEDEEKD